MKTKNITISVPTDLIATLQGMVGKRELSKFITKAIKKAVEEEKTSLAAAYAASDNDLDTIDVINDWKVLDTEDWE
jgi:ATP-dependent protease HslVU (ClpYQ) ATPase subunit